VAKVDVYWHKRWEALDSDLAALQVRVVEAAANDRLPEKYAQLVEGLRMFVEEQFKFFFFGFGGGDEMGDQQRLERSLAHPPEYVLRRTLDQAAYDLTIVRLAIAQRTEPSDIALKTLSLTSTQAKEYLELVQPRLIPPRVQVITYFQRGTSIRVIPYADAALIGVPPTAMVKDSWRELLAVGHEVGHYVYQNGFEDGERMPSVLSHKNRRRPAYVRRWQEEIFADVFGALVTGNPAVFYSARDMIADNPAFEAVLDDGEHPIDALRLHVYEGVNDWLGKKFGKRWTIPSAEEFYGANDYFVTSDSQRALQQVPLTQAAQVLQDTAHEICDFLHGAMKPEMQDKWDARLRHRPDEPGKRELIEDDGLLNVLRDKYYESFGANLSRIETSEGGAAEVAGDSPRIRRWFEEYRDRLKTQRFRRPVPQAGWDAVFYADGWTGSESHGPETNPPKGGWERDAGLWLH